MHIHLDLIGGLSGNMFVGAMLDHLKTPIPTILLQIERAGYADLVELTATSKNDGVMLSLNHIQRIPRSTPYRPQQAQYEHNNKKEYRH